MVDVLAEHLQRGGGPLAVRGAVDLSGLTDEEKVKLLTIVRRSIDKVCTVGRTLKSGTEVTLSVVDEPLARRESDSDEALARRESDSDVG